MTASSDLHFIKGVEEKPEQAPNSPNSRWIRIHLFTGLTCLGYYSYKKNVWREFKDLKNLYHASTIDEKYIKGWNY